MTAYLIEDRIIEDNGPVISRLSQKGFGKVRDNKLELSLIEGLYLIERGSITVTRGGKEVTPQEIHEMKKESDFHVRFKVYQDLRDRGYVVKSGFKFGAHFRLYERGEFKDSHSKLLVYSVPEDYTISFPEMSRAVRLSQGVKKKLMFAVVDDEGDITYYEVERVTP